MASPSGHVYENQENEECQYVYEEEKKQEERTVVITPPSNQLKTPIQHQDSDLYDICAEDSDSEQVTTSYPTSNDVEDEKNEKRKDGLSFTVYIPKYMIFGAVVLVAVGAGVGIGYIAWGANGEGK